jgi:hypothetical protein
MAMEFGFADTGKAFHPANRRLLPPPAIDEKAQ